MPSTSNGKVWVLHLQSSGTPDKSYVKCGTNPALKFPGNQPYTLTAKLYMGDSNGTIMGNLKGSNWDGSGTIMGYAVLPLGNSLRAYRSGKPYDCDTGTISLLNKWIHLIVSFDGDTYSIYVDGKLIKSQSGFQPIESAPANLEFLIGSMYRGNEIGNCFGSIMIYDMAVLSVETKESEIKQLANLSKDSDSPLVALWDFTSKTAKDLTGNGNDGTLVGKAEFVLVDEPYILD